MSRLLNRIRVSPRAAILVAGVLSWIALYVSLEAGRTTPSTLSRGWLATFAGMGAAAGLWGVLFGLALRRLSRSNRAPVSTQVLATSAPLLVSTPLLAAIYLSDEVFHYLAANPVPHALVLWVPPVATLMWQEATLIWSVSLEGSRLARLTSREKAPILIFATFAVLYVFTAGGHLYSPDERSMYQVTRNMAETVLAAVHLGGPDPHTTPREGPYSKYGLVPSLAALPPYWISRMTGPMPDPPSAAFPIPNGAYPLVDLLVAPLATAAICGLLYALARRLGFQASVSLAVVLVYGMGTSAWVYSKTFFNQPLAALLLLSASYLLLRADRLSVRDCALVGIALGLAAGTRAEMIALAVPLAVPFVSQLKGEPRERLKRAGAFALFFVALAGTTLGWYNYVKTGSIFVTGYGGQGTPDGFFSREPLIGLFGSLFSPGFGFFVFNPIALLGILSLPLMAMRLRREAYLFGGLIALAILLYGSFQDWFAGFTWGNRYLDVILPFAILPAAMLLERPWRTPLSVAMVSGAVCLGLLVNFWAVLFDFNSGWLDLWDHRANLDLILWDPHFSPIVGQLRVLQFFLFTGSKLDLYIYYKLGLPALMGFLLLFTAFATLAVRSALSHEEDDSARNLRLAEEGT